MKGVAAKTAYGPDGLSDSFSHVFSLKKSFGKAWKIQMEESWGSETAENRRGYEGWFETIPTLCGGFISLYQHYPTVILMFFTSKKRLTCRKLAEQLKDSPGVRLDDWFDGYETILYFPLSLFATVAAAVGARKRRMLSPEHKAKLAEAGKATQFNSGFHGSKARHNPQKETIPTPAEEKVMGKKTRR